MRITTRTFALASLIFLAAGGTAFADATVPTADIEGAADTALLKRYEGSFIVSYERSEYTDISIPLSPLKQTQTDGEVDKQNNIVFRPDEEIELEGAVTRIAYVLPEGRSPLEVLRNYQDVVEEAGGSILFECKREECGGDEGKSSDGGGGKMSLMQYFVYDDELNDADFSNGSCALTSEIADQRFFAAKIPQGDADAHVAVHTFTMLDDLYCKELNGRTIALVHVVEPDPRDKQMVVVEAAEMENTIDAQGSISLYGIYFDTDKSDIKPESEATLKEIAKLLTDSPDLAVLVVGHTDSQGAFGYNVDLSSRRAAAVKDALVKSYSIDGGRLTSAGAGMMAPVDSNDNDEGRAKNRRVVLVKAN